ncbi:zf-C3HC-domain-containing protein [Hygrophoropsis aurantiaca]|uniref:Zf-C3HC-domain-containing protein n=1 Tax=Hygrophoropsis aurantiaca TaxID=72124 RepID=A0ACB8AQR9_9AGAM|nr:zf-C3HC-domain-containing protein [Hygrophoropsis aurantiaca]
MTSNVLMSTSEIQDKNDNNGIGRSMSTSSISSIRATKRKLDDAIQSLDEAVTSSSTLNHTDAPPPAKRPHFTRSIYSTLTKYGIKSKEPRSSHDTTEVGKHDVSKMAPHLAAILARTSSRTRQTHSSKLPRNPPAALPPHSASDYRPSSTQSFLSRLSTYKLSTYANKPTAIDAVAAAKCGWINDGKDRLLCGICGVSWVVAGRDGMNRDAANTLVEKQRLSLVEAHKAGCPWRTKQCDDSIYRVPLQSPAAMARDIISNSRNLEPVLNGVSIKHPLSNSQMTSLRATLSSTLPHSLPEDDSSMQVVESNSSPFEELSDTAIITTLFGWALAPPQAERPRTSSLSRATSVAPTIPPSPSLSRASSVSRTLDRENTPTPGGSRPPLHFRTPRLSEVGIKRDSSLLHCILCQRRIGLWAFTSVGQQSTAPGEGNAATPPPQRQFDVLKEHRSYCPYVVRSTVVPSLPVPQISAAPPMRSPSSLTQLSNSNGAMEGWRAALAVILRYGMGNRQRSALSRTLSELSGVTAIGNQDQSEMDGVEAMIAGVKSKGGRELLKYVKGLLG